MEYTTLVQEISESARMEIEKINTQTVLNFIRSTGIHRTHSKTILQDNETTPTHFARLKAVHEGYTGKEREEFLALHALAQDVEEKIV